MRVRTYVRIVVVLDEILSTDIEIFEFNVQDFISEKWKKTTDWCCFDKNNGLWYRPLLAYKWIYLYVRTSQDSMNK